MREQIKQFVRICSETLPISEPVYEFGALQVRGQEGFADLRPLFLGKKYVGADMRGGPGVDVVLNLHDINLPSESVGTALVVETLEHVEFPRKAVEKVHNILKTDGILIISSAMNFRIHEHPHDYWRFTPEGFRSLLEPFAASFIDFAGEAKFPHTVVGIGFKGSIPETAMAAFRTRFEHWKRRWSQISRTRWKRLGNITVSAIRLEIYRKIKESSLRE